MNQAEQLRSVVAAVSGGFRADLEEFILAQSQLVLENLQEMCEDCPEVLDVAALRAAAANILFAMEMHDGEAVVYRMRDRSVLLATDGYMDLQAELRTFSSSFVWRK